MRFYDGNTILNKPFRNVNDKQVWLEENPQWSEVSQDFTPPKTNNELFTEEFKARKAEYDADIQSLTLAMAGIILKDGPNEADKKTELQALESATTAEYNNDIAALRAKYYG